MHGRLKVKTTAQQELERRAEKTKKAQAYQAAMSLILDQRDAGVQDEQQMRMCAGILLANPDVTVCWNIRKEILEAWLARIQGSERSDEPSVEKATVVFLKKEVELTQQCLMANPKSYGSWFHRTWCLERIPEPDWEREIKLCSQLLAMDDRNFHCWDYRRWVVGQAQVPPEDELAFTHELIHRNFSNYSAWHYRSKLLPLLHPNAKPIAFPIHSDQRAKEIELVRNAAFTDPEDTSAWFYHSWLIGPTPTRCPLLAVSRGKTNQVLVTFSARVDTSQFHAVKDERDVEPQEWLAVDGALKSKMWSLGCNSKERIVLSFHGAPGANSPSLALAAGETVIQSVESDFFAEVSDEVLSTLKEDRNFIEELVELEEDAKWPRMAILKSLGNFGHDDQTVPEALKHLEFLGQVDGQRKEYFQDMRSDTLLRWKLGQQLPESLLSLTSLKLTRVSLAERLVLLHELDLSNNELKHTTSFLPFLQNCSVLDLSRNHLDSLDGIQFILHAMTVAIVCNPLSRDEAALRQLKADHPHLTVTNK